MRYFIVARSSIWAKHALYILSRLTAIEEILVFGAWFFNEHKVAVRSEEYLKSRATRERNKTVVERLAAF